MTALHQVVDPQLLDAMLAEGYVRIQHHPHLPYSIYNYTEKAAYEAVWNEATLNCRGLIVENTTGAVLARPFKKFFNYGQTGAPALDLDARAIVTDKQDGSLGIIYPTPDGWAVATRGSFTSEQAIHATEVLRTRYRGWEAPQGFTVLCEIVYPANRIVLDYGELDDLVLLGVVDIADGYTFSPAALPDWPGPVTQTFSYRSLAEALAAPPRPNAEGLVVHVFRTGERIKIKQDDYVALHRIVTGLNARTVWQHLIDGKPLDELITPLPDEFHPWCLDVAGQLTALVDLRQAEADKAYGELRATMPQGWTRKDFAIAAKQHPLSWALFMLLDGRDIRPKLWANAKPEPHWTPSGRVFNEDTA